LKDQGEDDIAHAEADGRGRGPAEEFDELVVAPAAGDGPLAPDDDLEDDAGVVRQAANDRKIEITP
jgi:hypothetical protein